MANENERPFCAERAAKEIFEVHPVILGGNPTDPANKVALTREQHIQAVRYWNKVIRDLRRNNPPEKNQP
jgi:hypothetical protein